MTLSPEIREFIKLNLGVLLNADDASEQWKEAKHDYFVVRLQRRVGIPRNTELARAVCEYCVEKHLAESPQKLKELVNRAPFLRDHIFDRDLPEMDLLFTAQPAIRPVLSRDELSRIDKEEYRAKKEKEIVDSASAKVTEKMAEVERLKNEIEKRYSGMLEQLNKERKQLEEERAETNSVKSAIDGLAAAPLDEIPYSIEQLSADPSVVGVGGWWERLGLTGNPFPTVDGLSDIDESHYENVVLRTPVFQFYYNLINTSSGELLRQTHLITGEFGSGKTTLFDYLKKPLFTHDLLPIHLILDSESDREQIRRSFYRSLLHYLADDYLQLTGLQLLLLYPAPEKEDLCQVLRELLSAKHLRGAIVMIDGLHKNDSLRNEAIGFIQILQNTRDYWVRNGVSIGVMIAGHKSWEQYLGLNSAIRGTVNHTEAIGGIDAAEAFEMISKRLATFSKDKERPAKMRRVAVERVYKRLKEKYPRDITFRDVVDEILPYLQKTDIGYVEISLPFDKDLLARLRKSVEGFPNLATSLDQLRERRDAFLPALQVLSVLLERTRIGERSPFFKGNEALFAMLAKVGLIQSMRVPGRSEWFWVPSRSVLDFGKKTELEVGLRPSEFLCDIFASKEESPPPLVENSEVQTLRGLVSAHRGSDGELASSLQLALDQHMPILEHALSPQDLISKDRLCGQLEESEVSALRALFLVVEPRTSPLFGGKTPQQWVGNSWVSPPEVHEFWRVLREVGQSQVDQQHAAEVTRSYLRAFSSTSVAIDRCLRLNAIVNLATPSLRRDDKIILNQARTLYSEGRFFESSRGLTDHVEHRLRDFIYDILTWIPREGTPQVLS